MAQVRCPGQDPMFWKMSDIFEIKCPFCGYEIEFWKDEPMRKCRACEREVRNPRIDMGCAKWCKAAAECLGTMSAHPDEARSVCDRAIEAMKAVFGEDKRRIHHALGVLRNAEEILRTEPGDPVVVKTAAVLHDIGIHEAERKHGSASGAFQELEGPPIARRILEEMNMDPSVIEHVCQIVGSHHSVKGLDTPEFRIVWDADWLVNIPEMFPDRSKDDLARLISQIFKTAKGLEMARKIYLNAE